ncbi:MAG: sarcosine oxidase subunit alpha family protein [Paracoccaceae bacterium]|nr:MAG: sarcosine oxidase subunit alpha family protein [Paracoccaceae bacterium]
MTARLPLQGRLIDRTRRLDFTFNGKRMTGHPGDTLASALLANGQMLVGRSFKYHRPRGILASGAEEPNALVNLGAGGHFEPNQRATTTELAEGMQAASQNHWPSLDFDIGALNAHAARFLPAGFYYKTFIHPRPFWKHVFEPVIRQSAGLGRAPKDRDADTYDQAYAFCDDLVIGGGAAGLAAARAAGRAGRRVILVEMTPHWGGRAPVEGETIEGQPAGDWVAATVAELAGLPNVTLRTRCMAAGIYDHGYALAEETLAAPGPRKRLWRIRAARVIAANGAHERPLPFPGNDVPGVMLAGAVRDYLVNWAVSPGDRTVIVTNNDSAYLTAFRLVEAGLMVPAILDTRPVVSGDLPDRARAMGIRVEPGRCVVRVKGGKRVTGIGVGLVQGEGAVLEEIACEAVAMSGGWTPAVHFWSHCGGKLVWDDRMSAFLPDLSRPPVNHDGAALVLPVGAAAGFMDVAQAVESAGALSGRMPDASQTPAIPAPAPVPLGAGPALKAKMWLDYQNDVKVSDVELAAREGYESVEHTKRYTTLGMATDQGKTSNINGLSVLAKALGTAIPDVGTTTFRPPYAPVTIGALAGEARGAIFQPLRRTPIHEWHEKSGAYWEPVGQWRRPYCFPRAGESHAQAVEREVNNTRQAVGMLDASTLGKIVVKGPDAGRFLDMLYTNVMSTLPIGRCRYGLMCNEQGFLSDDGVVARLDADTWLCHTTSGGADRIHGWMEDWLQCEWWDWQVFTANLTEQYGQIAVVGPKARALLESLGGMDVSKEALPFMGWSEGTLAGHPVRVFRISFSGELSYEISVPSGQTLQLWSKIAEAGAAHGIMPYGTEALHVMRAEKGFIMIGDETDGTVIPQDLGLDWAISKKKADYLGKRGQERSHFHKPDRWKLVGLETTDGSVIPDGAYAVAEGVNDNGQKMTEGRVTSTYYSPTLKRGIAMGLVARGPERMGQTLRFTKLEGGTVEARIVNPVFYDPKGERQDV